jgi:hypothetical protein
MSVGVARPHADERLGGSPYRERLGEHAVDAAVVRGLHDPERSRGRCPAQLQGTQLRALLGVAEQQGRAPAALDPQDHARVVGLQVRWCLGRRPQHGDVPGPDLPRHPGVKRRPRAAGERLGGGAGAAQRRAVCEVRAAYPAHTRHADEPPQAADVVGMGVGQHHAREVADPLARQRLP